MRMMMISVLKVYVWTSQHHYIKHPILVLGVSFFLCRDFDHFFLFQSFVSILSTDLKAFKYDRSCFWTWFGLFCNFFSFLVVGKSTMASKNINFECFPVNWVTLKPIKFQRLQVVYVKSLKNNFNFQNWGNVPASYFKIHECRLEFQPHSWFSNYQNGETVRCVKFQPHLTWQEEEED